MIEKAKAIALAVIIAGVIMFVMGCYYMVLKAGIPYQDPPLELQIEYAVNMGIGSSLIKSGGLTLFIGLVPRILLIFIKKRDKK